MYLYKRGKYWWVKVMRNGVVHRFSTKSTSKKDARDYAEKVKIVKRCGFREAALKMVDILFPPEGGGGIPLAQAWDVYRKIQKSTGMDNLAERTMITRRRVFDRLLRWLAAKRPGVTHIEDIDGPVAAGFAEALAQTKNHKGVALKAKTRANVIAELSTVFTLLSKASPGVQDPWKGLVPRATDGGRTEAFTRDQERAVMDAARKVGKGWPLACLIARHTGLRYGDVAMLDWSQIDLGKRTINLTPQKTARHGVTVLLPLADDLYAALRAEAAANGTKGYVLPNHAENYANPSGSAYLRLNFREVLNAAGIGEGWTFHSWRHTFRSRLSEAGVDMETAKRLCGHTQDETSRHYDHAAHIEEYRSAIAAAAK